MSEVEKMYENANLTNLYCGDDYITECMLEFECTDGDKEKCKTCDKVKIGHPPFTADKQLELIKWLCQNTYQNYLLIGFNPTNYFWQIESNMTDGNTVDNFSEALASICNNIFWEDLTEEQRKQIKGILE